MATHKKIKLLFIDDSLTNHHLVKKTLENTHIEYTGCSSSEEARMLLAEKFFDVIAQDVVRAGDEMNGFAFTTWLRRRCPNPTQRNVPIIIISVHEEELLKKEQSRHGYNAFFDPCFISKRLVPTIDSVLQNR